MSFIKRGTKFLSPAHSVRRKRPMKMSLTVAAAVLASACTTVPVAKTIIPVEVVQGKLVHLWSVSAQRMGDGISVSGFAQRRLTPNGPVDEHLHADAVSGDGQVLHSIPVRWNSFVSLRSRRSTAFQTEFSPEVADGLARVRLSVVPGAVHTDGQ